MARWLLLPCEQSRPPLSLFVLAPVVRFARLRVSNSSWAQYWQCWLSYCPLSNVWPSGHVCRVVQASPPSHIVILLLWGSASPPPLTSPFGLGLLRGLRRLVTDVLSWFIFIPLLLPFVGSIGTIIFVLPHISRGGGLSAVQGTPRRSEVLMLSLHQLGCGLPLRSFFFEVGP